MIRKVFVWTACPVETTILFLLASIGKKGKMAFVQVDNLDEAEMVIVAPGLYLQRETALHEAVLRGLPTIVVGSDERHRNAATRTPAAYFDTREGFGAKAFMDLVEETVLESRTVAELEIAA